MYENVSHFFKLIKPVIESIELILVDEFLFGIFNQLI